MGSGYRKLGLPDEEELRGRGVSWCATCDGFFFRDKDIAVVGGGDSAMEEATFLTRFAEVGDPGPPPRRAARLEDHAGPRLRRPEDPLRLEHRGRRDPRRASSSLSGLDARDTVTGETSELPTSTGLFVAIGHDPRSELVRGQVDLDADGYVLVDAPRTRTNLPGVFAAGDLVDHTYRQAITAAGTGCAAALDAERYLAALDDEAATTTTAAESVVEAVQTAGA